MSATILSAEELPQPIREIENVWIPMPDGCRLAARLWLPAEAEARPVPALLEYLPYRKRDGTRSRDEPMHRYLTAHGYACVRVDIRGSGDSDGILTDEYSPQELDDGVAVVAWLAAQPWCDGGVGMFGKSWGGFNALQIAALQPPALKAILSVCASDDRYADDAHYMGGCLLNENLLWGAALFNFNALPPDPDISGPAWREKWLQRLEHATLFPALWLRHQHRDEYWRRGSVCEDYGAIRCPVYAVGGWADAYSDAVPRLLAGLAGPRKGLIGPWAHAYPHDGLPAPAIGFLQEALRWWDHWLKGRDTGIMAEPMLRVWMQERVPPRSRIDERPGRWVAEASWPSPLITATRLWLRPGRLDEEPGGDVQLPICSPPWAGLAGGEWCPFTGHGDMPFDQRWDDSASLVFDGKPLAADLEILGNPVVALEVAADRPNAMLAVRLSDVAADGSAERVTYGLLNLTHREGHASPIPIRSGERMHVAVELNAIAHRFGAGNRIRVAVSTCYWPIAWPSPERATVTVSCRASHLDLPVRAPSSLDSRLAPFHSPAMARADYNPKSPPVSRRLERDLTQDRIVQIVETGDGAIVPHLVGPDGLVSGSRMRRRYRIADDDPLSAEASLERRTEFARGDWFAAVAVTLVMTATREAFRIEATLAARDGETDLFARTWDERIPRELV